MSVEYYVCRCCGKAVYEGSCQVLETAGVYIRICEACCDRENITEEDFDHDSGEFKETIEIIDKIIKFTEKSISDQQEELRKIKTKRLAMKE